jgi:cytoskeletal protein CcmA (bactofilin family)
MSRVSKKGKTPMAENRFRRMLDKSRGATTFIAPGSRFEGNISSDDNVLVCGEVAGDCNIKAALTLAEGSRWEGNIRATNAIIGGELVGEVQTEGQIEIAATARIKGTVSGGTVAIAEGAVLEGEVRISSGEAAKVFTDKRSRD